MPTELKKINTPVNAVLIEDELDPTRWIVGVNSEIEYEIVNPSGDWLNNLPTNERQSNRYVDVWGCTNFWGLSGLEIQLDWQIEHNLLSPRALAFLGGDNCANIDYYDENGKVNLSDKFTYIKTGTKVGVGNYVYKTPHSVRHDGAIPEKMLPFGDPKTAEEFSDPSQITELMEQLGHEFAEVFETQYETLVIAGKTKDEIMEMVDKHMMQAPLSLAIAVCDGYMTDNPVLGCNRLPVHCVGMVKKYDDLRKAIYDSYPEFVKYLASDYILPYFLKSIIFEKNKPNNNAMKAIKTEGNPHIYLLDHTGKNKIMVLDPPTLDALGVPVETVNQEDLDAIPTKGTMVWAEREIKD